ncbi:MAG TPA: choice-of-anchor Q domain-containing protein [Chthoniobacterales bacterium]|nr:choice-of-anchor Q domain-containing protein [Chthoniobacterales bacterium]
MTPPALPANWVASQGVNVTGAPFWVTSDIAPDTAPNDAFSTAPDNILDNRLDTAPFQADPFGPGITFQNNYNLESGRDGAVLEISSPNINGGAFTDITDPAVGGSISPGYNSVISSAFGSPIAGRMAWSGNSGGYVLTQVFYSNATLPPSQIRLRFRLVSDNSGASEGWRIDSLTFLSNECPSPPPSPPPTPTPSATPTPTATIFPTATPTPSPTVTPSPTPAQALNISTRLRVETGDHVMIGGFIITGNQPKRVALRAIGPSLSDFGLSDVLADPTLELRGSDGALLLQNDDWQDEPFGGKQIANLGLAPQDPNESGMVATLPPGAYTAIVAGKDQTSGLALVEIYDADTAADSRLANISTRGFVRTGDNVMIGGFILGQGSASVDVAVRGLGPSLVQSGLTDVLVDPTLELHDGNGALLIANDNWQDDPISAAQLTAHGLAPPNALESGIFTTLPPGLFTAILAGKDGGIGLGLAEIYSGVGGSTLTVTSTADSGAGSLRAAIAAAADGDTIQFDAALSGNAITLTSAELVIDKNITISGPGPAMLAVSRVSDLSTSFRIFHVMPGHIVLIEGLTIRDGRASEFGGGIFNDQATVTINNCTVRSNFAPLKGGGIYNNGSNATMTIVNSAVTGNFMGTAGGGTGAGTGAGIYNDDGTITISNSVVSGNITGRISFPPNFGGDAGGVYSTGTLAISNSTISGNVANQYAGGIDNSGGTLELTNSVISGNQTAFAGGGIANSGTLTISHSTLSGNSAYYKWFGVGGGISNVGTLEIRNSTLSGNRVDGGGGGISNSSGAVTITNSTLTDNYSIHTEAVGGGGLRNVDGGTLQIGNSILHTGSSDANFNNSATVISHGYNLSSDSAGGLLTGAGDQINTNPMLGPLQDNGGPTFTHALLTGSPTIDAGDPNFTPPPVYDQRGPGYDRVVGGRIDVGAFELQP